MKYLIVLPLALLLFSCRTQKAGFEHERIDSVYIEKLVPVALPPDSASIRALLECDENGKVVLKWLDLANTKNVELMFQLDSLGNLLAKMKVPPDTVYLPSKEKLVYKDKIVQKIEMVEKKLSWFQSFFIRSGKILWCLIPIYMLFKYRKKIFRL